MDYNLNYNRGCADNLIDVSVTHIRKQENLKKMLDCEVQIYSMRK